MYFGLDMGLISKMESNEQTLVSSILISGALRFYMRAIDVNGHCQCNFTNSRLSEDFATLEIIKKKHVAINCRSCLRCSIVQSSWLGKLGTSRDEVT